MDLLTSGWFEVRYTSKGHGGAEGLRDEKAEVKHEMKERCKMGNSP